ncbi:hypothetical protein M5K25_025680 [Dendrobium thyrsiflorum]|uniref:Uncharacterized protein n=1 Tax=Dendrobium thyrsiflorum TaxID=117978 RepID=A0ABD0U9Q5_DENTH
MKPETSAIIEKISIGALVQSTKLLLSFEESEWQLSRYITMTVMSSWKCLLVPRLIFLISSYLISLFFAATLRAAFTNLLAMPCNTNKFVRGYTSEVQKLGVGMGKLTALGFLKTISTASSSFSCSQRPSDANIKNNLEY